MKQKQLLKRLEDFMIITERNIRFTFLACTVLLIGLDFASLLSFNSISTQYTTLANKVQQLKLSEIHNVTTLYAIQNYTTATTNNYMGWEANLSTFAGILLGFYALAFIEIFRDDEFGSDLGYFFFAAFIAPFIFLPSLILGSSLFPLIINSANLNATATYYINNLLNITTYPPITNVTQAFTKYTMSVSSSMKNNVSYGWTVLITLLATLDDIIIVIIGYALYKINTHERKKEIGWPIRF